MKEQETALRHEHAEEMHGLKAQHKADMLALIEDRDQQILKIQREANEQQMNDQRNRSGEVSKLEEERRVLMQKLERASDDVYNARQQYNGELSLLRRALQCQQKEHEKAVAVMSGMCQQIEFVESQYRVIVEEKTKADRELLSNLGNTEQELQRMRTRFADQERWTAYLNSVIETVEDERDMHESGAIERDKRIEALQKEITLLNERMEKVQKEKDSAQDELQRKGMDTELEVARREKEIMQAQVRLEAEQTEIMEGKLKSMEAHVAALEQECTRLADARDWLESEKIIMEQDLMAEIHRLEQEVRRAHDERDRLSLVQRIFDDQQQRGGAGAT
jgi:chromosome segregation ATPase